MPPKIALVLCIIFVLYILNEDIKYNSKTSLALWIPLIWIMIIGSRMPAYWFDHVTVSISPESYKVGNPFNRNVFIILIIIGLIILFRRKIRLGNFVNNNRLLTIFFLYCGISVIWSDYPMVSSKRFLKAMGNIIMVLIVLTESKPKEAVITLLRRSAYVLIPFSIVLIKYYPSLGRTYHPYTGELMIIGVAGAKNNLGQLCMVYCIFFFWHFFLDGVKKKGFLKNKNNIFQAIVLIIAIWLLVKSDNATSTVCFVIGVFILLGFSLPIFKGITQKIRGNTPLLFFIVFPFIILGYDYYFTTLVEFTGHAETFWGRTSIWPELINMMNSSQIVGTGYDSFWLGDRMAILWEKYWWHPTQAHNGYVETFLELGWVGLMLLIGVVFESQKKITKELTSNFEHGIFRITFLIIILLSNVTESAFKGLHLIWFLFLLISIEYPKLNITSGPRQRVLN